MPRPTMASVSPPPLRPAEAAWHRHSFHVPAGVSPTLPRPSRSRRPEQREPEFRLGAITIHGGSTQPPHLRVQRIRSPVGLPHLGERIPYRKGRQSQTAHRQVFPAGSCNDAAYLHPAAGPAEAHLTSRRPVRHFSVDRRTRRRRRTSGAGTPHCWRPGAELARRPRCSPPRTASARIAVRGRPSGSTGGPVTDHPVLSPPGLGNATALGRHAHMAWLEPCLLHGRPATSYEHAEQFSSDRQPLIQQQHERTSRRARGRRKSRCRHGCCRLRPGQRICPAG